MGNRAGKEPAEDVSRRMVAACEEVGLVVHKKMTRLGGPENNYRAVFVWASSSGVPIQKESSGLCFTSFELRAVVGVDGRWTERVEIIASTQDVHLDSEGLLIDPFYRDAALMRLRAVPLSDLASELMDVVRERKLVQDALAKGEQGPWTFTKSTWVKGPIP
jgi:hypothetical protein